MEYTTHDSAYRRSAIISHSVKRPAVFFKRLLVVVTNAKKPHARMDPMEMTSVTAAKACVPSPPGCQADGGGGVGGGVATLLAHHGLLSGLS